MDNAVNAGKGETTMAKTTLYCLVYRTGGTDNFTWHRSLAMSKDEAIAAYKANGRAGRVGYVEKYELSLSVGLPETYDVMASLQDLAAARSTIIRGGR